MGKQSWKSKSTFNKFSSLKVNSAFHSTWEKKKEENDRQKQVKQMELELKEQAQKEEEARKEKRRKKIQQKKVNEQKSMVVQPITNSKKLKKLTKKQRKQLVMMATA